MKQAVLKKWRDFLKGGTLLFLLENVGSQIVSLKTILNDNQFKLSRLYQWQLTLFVKRRITQFYTSFFRPSSHML